MFLKVSLSVVGTVSDVKLCTVAKRYRKVSEEVNTTFHYLQAILRYKDAGKDAVCLRPPTSFDLT